METLKERIEELMRATTLRTQAEVARAAGVTEAAVNQWLSGATKSLKSEAALRLQKRTGFSWLWLSKGSGPKLHATSEVAAVPMADALDMALNGIASVANRQELKVLLGMIVDTDAPAYRARLLELIEGAPAQAEERRAAVEQQQTEESGRRA